MQDILLILLAICGFGVAGVLGAITALDWTNDFPIDQDTLRHYPLISDAIDLRDALAATSVSS